MAYSTANPPVLTEGGGLTNATFRVWAYQSTDASTVVRVTGYITNGRELGMEVGDIVNALDTSTGIVTVHRVVTVASTGAGAVDLGDATTIGSATNSD